MGRRWEMAGLTLALGVAVACGYPPTVLAVDPARYATTCGVRADCVAVFLGNACAPCPCPTAAISTSSEALLQADLAAIRPYCSPHGPVSCTPCLLPVVGCDGGHCTLDLQ